MNVSKFSRKFHDPWGNKQGNRRASTIRWQYMAGQDALMDPAKAFEDCDRLNDRRHRFDLVSVYERNSEKYVHTTKHSQEKLRR